MSYECIGTNVYEYTNIYFLIYYTGCFIIYKDYFEFFINMDWIYV